MHVIISCSSVCVCVCELGNSKPSTKIWDSQAKQWPREECEGVYKQSHLQKRVILLVFCSQNMRTRWTNSHQYQQHANSSSMSTSSNTNTKGSSQGWKINVYNIYANHFILFSRRLKINHNDPKKNMCFFLRMVLLRKVMLWNTALFQEQLDNEESRWLKEGNSTCLLLNKQFHTCTCVFVF